MTPEEQQIAATKRLGVNRPVGEVLALLRALLDFDATMAAKRKKAGCSIPIAIVVAIGAFLASGFSFGLLAKIALAVSLLAVAGAVAAIVLFVRFKGMDLSDNLRVAAVPFLVVLAEDMNGNDPLHVNIDLRPYALEEKKKSESAPYKKGVYYKVIDRLYVDPWFNGSAGLADGTKVRWSVTEHIVEHHKTKKTSRGKIKSKTKISRKTVAAVTLAFATKEYAVSADAEAGEKRATMTLARKTKTSDASSPAFDTLVDLIAEGYRKVRVAKSA
jgi:hypothetical protein